MGKEIKIKPEELKASLSQMGNELASLTSVFTKIKFSAKKNTVNNVKEYDDIIDTLNGLSELYVASFKDSIGDLINSVGQIKNVDEIISKGISSKSLYSQQQQQKYKDDAANYSYDTSSY